MKKVVTLLAATLLASVFFHCKKDHPETDPLSFDCPADITVTTPFSWATNFYQVPVAHTTCANGGVTVALKSGLGPTDQFVVGVYEIVYEATDNCNNTATCSFTVTVKSAVVACGENANPDIKFTPYTVGQQLIFQDAGGTHFDALVVERYSNEMVTYQQMGIKCTRDIQVDFRTPWKNASGEAQTLKVQLVGYNNFPTRLVSTKPGDFAAASYDHDPYFLQANARVFVQDSCTIAGQTYQDVMLARCGEPGDLNYAADKCNCPTMKRLVFRAGIGLVGYENETGQWRLK